MDDPLRYQDIALGNWVDGLYALRKSGEIISRHYASFPAKKEVLDAIKKCGPAAYGLFLHSFPGSPRLYLMGRRALRGAPLDVWVTIRDRKSIPPTLDASMQDSGIFEVYKLVCGNFTPEVGEPLPSVGCTSYGARISRSLTKVAATRIFANPYQCFSELVVNSYDAYHPNEKFGKFGMGFFSVLWWVYKDPSAVFRMRSFIPGESWTLEIRMVNGDLQGDLRILRSSRVTLRGTEIDVESSLIEKEKASAEIGKLFNLPRISEEVHVEVVEGRVSVDDFATGIPLKVLATSLLVPSVSTKTIAGFGGSGGRLETRIIVSKTCKVTIAVGFIIILSLELDIELKYEIIIGLSHLTHLPVSRDDVIIDSEQSKAELTLALKKVLEWGLPEALYVMQTFVKKYETMGAPKINVDIFSQVLSKWQENNVSKIVPWTHFNTCYIYLGRKDLIVSTFYDARKIEEAMKKRASGTQWLSVSLVLLPEIPAPTFGGLTSVMFSHTADPKLIAQSMTDRFLIKAIPDPDSIDLEIRTKALTPVEKILGSKSQAVTDAYIYLASSAAVFKTITVNSIWFYKTRKEEIENVDPLVYFAGWLERHVSLPDIDLVDVLTFFASRIGLPDMVISDSNTPLTPENRHIYVSAILRSSFHHPKHLIVSPSLGDNLNTFLVATDMEEYAVLTLSILEGEPDAMETKEVPVSTQRFLLNRFLLKINPKEKKVEYDWFYTRYVSHARLEFVSEAKQWLNLFQKTPRLLAPSSGWGSATYSIKKLISSLFAIQKPPEEAGNVKDRAAKIREERDFYLKVGTYPPTPLQLVDIAVNDAGTRSPIAASLSELYQNSMDAGSKMLLIEAGTPQNLSNYPGPHPSEGYVVLHFEDFVGMSASNFFHVQIPFLSTKTEGSSAGEMGSGFFNVFRATSFVEVTSVSKTGIYRHLIAAPKRDSSGRVVDIDCRASVDSAHEMKAGTVVRCHYPCNSLEEKVIILAEIESSVSKLVLSPANIVVNYQGNFLKTGREVWNEGITDPAFTVCSGSGLAYTKGVYFGPIGAIDPSLEKVNINLVKGFEPVHSRNKINLDPQILKRLKFVSSLVTEELPMTDFVHFVSFSIPSITPDSIGAYVGHEIVPGVTFITLMKEIARQSDNRINGSSPEMKLLTNKIVDELVGTHTQISAWVASRLVDWAKTKIAVPEPKKTSLKKSSKKKTFSPSPKAPRLPHYFTPSSMVVEFVENYIKRYQKVCKEIGMPQSPINTTFFDNPTEIGMAGFRVGQEIAVGLDPSMLPSLEEAIQALKKDSTNASRILIRDRSWVWSLLGTGTILWGQKSSTLAHELEHFRRNDIESEGSHAPRVEKLLGVSKSRTFDESASLISSWVASKINLFS